MKVGSRGDYGLRALIYLAVCHLRQGVTKPVQIHCIAAHQQIPEDYLRQLLVNLRLAGLVKSVRGPHGGYMLAKSAMDISMVEILDVLEGRPETMHCKYLDEGLEKCSVIGACEMRAKWRNSTEKMRESMQATTLAELAKDAVSTVRDEEK